MRLIFGLVLLAGLALAGFAIHTAQQRFAQYQAALASSQQSIVPTQEVFVVRRQLKYGDALRPNDVRGIQWPASSLPTGTFRSMAEIFPPGVAEQRTVLRMMERNEPLLKSKVTAPGQEAGIAATLTPGMRAFTLQTDVNSGVSGFLRPGDRVDVYWTGGGGGGGVTKLIEANLPLIAIDQQTDEQRNSPTIARNITVEASPAIVAKLAQAQATGRLSLALVGVQDDTESESVEATLREVLGAEETAARPEVCTVRTRKGADVVMIPVPCPRNGG
ncbi:Flp pilus assembly protein CpaB [Jannaschia pagri]|uniref:Flp pilus assembly protein CpaB n=1 Tax=Jannaschia pagri TaxID=2829797 RepID=A0ABQ4NHQ8_9RHOB|nr:MULTISPECIES: Flp pilus assembly protein CpaB [unclassified Jannaschia]GIT89925.1 Flp pilus assembly protein CpaB [Jannaschia sp. AI_61]GIT93968.1 Flp pilus assembly protein CpaB [Jannaschia sp. AI_62]